MTATSSTTVSLRGVTKRYRSLAALDGVDLDLGPGITGLLGPNGAGKTTMLRVMATVLRPDDGEVRLLGRDPGDPDARTEVRRRLGYQPQELGFPRGFSTMAFVNYMAVLKEWADRDLARRRCGACSTSSGSATSRRSGSAGSPAASADGSRWPRPCSARRSCSSSTSRRPGSTRSSAPRCVACSPTSPRRRPW